MRSLVSHFRFYLSYPFVMAIFAWRQCQEWRRITPRVWLSSGQLLARDLESYVDGGRKQFDLKLIEDFAKARDDLYTQIKKQMLLSFLIFVFLSANYFKVGVDISIAGFSLRYAPGIPEGLLLISNLLSCYTLILQGNSYLLEITIKSVIALDVAPELRAIYLVKYFPHEYFGGYRAFNLPYLIPNRFHRGAVKFTSFLFLALLFVIMCAFSAANIFLLIYHLWLHPNFGVWSYLLLAYIFLLGLGSFVYFALTRLRLPYLDYTTNNELELLEQVDPERWRARLDELYGALNARRAEMEEQGYVKKRRVERQNDVRQ